MTQWQVIMIIQGVCVGLLLAHMQQIKALIKLQTNIIETMNLVSNSQRVIHSALMAIHDEEKR